jgi:glycosyltransferase involved in cell wall biosynthesis
MVEYLHHQGHVVEVMFTGYLYPPDVSALRAEPPEFALHALGERTESSSDKPSASMYAWIKRLRNMLRQLGCEATRVFERKPSVSEEVTRRFALQICEPKLSDFESDTTLVRFREACRDFAPDVVIIEYVRLTWLLQKGRSALPDGCLSLIDTHDVQYERQSRFHARGEVHDIDITPAEEGRALSVCDVVIAIQSTDAYKLRALVPGKKVIVAGFPCQLHRHPTRPDGFIRIGFFGSSMLPNRQAAENLIRHIYPLTLERCAGAVELHVFGGVCAELGSVNSPEGVYLHGFVDDLLGAYASVDIIANPVSFGGGLKIKNVEALCHGRALVTTPIGAEGLENGVGSAFLVASNEEEFAGLLGRLVNDSAERLALGESALAFARDHFTEAAAYRELNAVLAMNQLTTAAQST